MIKYKSKGVTLAELIVSVMILSIVMLSTAGFTFNFMDASTRTALQIKNVDQARTIFESISKEVANAAYIYPANIDIDLTSSGEEASVTINTNEAVAMLYEYDNYGYITYGFTAFFLVSKADGSADLYQFTEYPYHTWTENTSPATTMTSFYGNTTKIISDIDPDNSSLSYILSYSNGLVDEVLLGEIEGATESDPNALIKGIDWEIAQSNLEKQTIKLKELSRNVPRFAEETEE